MKAPRTPCQPVQSRNVSKSTAGPLHFPCSALIAAIKVIWHSCGTPNASLAQETIAANAMSGDASSEHKLRSGSPILGHTQRLQEATRSHAASPLVLASAGRAHLAFPCSKVPAQEWGGEFSQEQVLKKCCWRVTCMPSKRILQASCSCCLTRLIA